MVLSFVLLMAFVPSSNAIPAPGHDPMQSATLTFKRSSVELSKTDLAMLKGLIAGTSAQDHVEIIGLPSRLERSSERLSRQRSERIAEFLKSNGIGKERIHLRTQSLPHKKPLRSDHTELSSAQRVEVQVLPYTRF